MAPQGLKGLPAAKGLWLGTHTRQKIGNSETLSSSAAMSHHPSRTLVTPLLLTCTHLSSPPIRRVSGGWGGGGVGG